MKKKIFIGTALCLTAILIYFMGQKAIYVDNSPDRERTLKIFPFRDSVVVYIPYQITVHNNRLMPLRLTGIREYARVAPWDHLLFNAQNVEIDELYDPKYNDLWNNYLKQKYRHTIFPFMKRTFYYFRPHVLSGAALGVDSSSFSWDLIRDQLKDLSKNMDIHIDDAMLDSLYHADDGKLFRLRFSKRGYENNFEIDLVAKINRPEQRLVSIRDSIRGMSDAEAKDFMINHVKKPVTEESDQF